jgi:hypothetical protein
MILAWLEPIGGVWVAKFRGAETPERMPVSRMFQSDHEARAWSKLRPGSSKQSSNGCEWRPAAPEFHHA